MTEKRNVTCKNDMGNMLQAQGKPTEQQERKRPGDKKSSQWKRKEEHKAWRIYSALAPAFSHFLP